jgi:hypothetical protein
MRRGSWASGVAPELEALCEKLCIAGTLRRVRVTSQEGDGSEAGELAREALEKGGADAAS